jgi:hypothetical protein
VIVICYPEDSEVLLKKVRGMFNNVKSGVRSFLQPLCQYLMELSRTWPSLSLVTTREAVHKEIPGKVYALELI